VGFTTVNGFPTEIALVLGGVEVWFEQSERPNGGREENTTHVGSSRNKLIKGLGQSQELEREDANQN
jgi:hypothetical protein